MVNAAYIVAHISMGYDGAPSRLTCQDGIRLANDIIDRCAVMLKKSGVIPLFKA